MRCRTKAGRHHMSVVYLKLCGRKELVNATQPSVWGIWEVFREEQSVRWFSSDKACNNWKSPFVSKRYPKGASETLRLWFLLKSEIVASVSLFLAQLMRWLAPPQPQFILGLCQLMSTALKEMVAANFLGKLLLFFKCCKEREPVPGETPFLYRVVYI